MKISLENVSCRPRNDKFLIQINFASRWNNVAQIPVIESEK
jgi:hypothetical protein